MSRIRFTPVAVVLLLAACGDDPSDPQPGPSIDCSGEFTEIDVEVTTTNDDVVFDWSPRCRVAMLGVEAEGGDRWWIGNEDTNRIEPTVTYGVTPDGVDGDVALPLVDGETYDVILWVATETGPYLAAVHEFER